MASRQANLGRGPARPLEASVKVTEAFDDPTSAKIGGLRFRPGAIKRCHQTRRGRQERSARSQAGPGLVSLLLRARAAARRTLPRSISQFQRVAETLLLRRARAKASQNHGLALPLAPAPRPQPAARPLAVAAARPLAAPRPEPVADARQDRRRHGRARHGHGLPLERPRLRVHQARAFYRVLYTKRGCSSVAERPLCMRKAQGSNPCSSTNTHLTPWRNG